MGRKKRSDAVRKKKKIPTKFHDPVCYLCDDAGDVIFCQGPCRRSFHGNKKDGERFNCPSLDLPEEDLNLYKAYPSARGARYLCELCKGACQLCFGCGKVGLLEKEALQACKLGTPIGQENSDLEIVFQCRGSRKCNRFFHQRCFPLKRAQNLVCDAHTCHGNPCQLLIRNAQAKDGQADELDVQRRLIRCRLCSNAWHEACIPQLMKSTTIITFKWMNSSGFIIEFSGPSLSISFDPSTKKTPQNAWALEKILITGAKPKTNLDFVIYCGQHYERDMPTKHRRKPGVIFRRIPAPHSQSEVLQNFDGLRRSKRPKPNSKLVQYEF